MANDSRNYLFKYYAKFLEQFQPKFFVFENVLGLLSAGNSQYFNEMKSLFEQLGYKVSKGVLKAEDFGVLQKRRRVILIGSLSGQEFDFSLLQKAPTTYALKEAILEDLPMLLPGQEMSIAYYTSPTNAYLEQTGLRNGVSFVTQHITRPHNERDLEIYKIAIEKWLHEHKRLQYSDLPNHLKTHKNTEAFSDRFKVIDPHGCAHTLVAHIAKDGHYYIYPDLKQIRSISVREAARIQSFPDDYYFEGGRSAAFKQIGNAVPPLMAREIARGIRLA
jgi:DNA (cytosine-5)-methyltransferase 1